MNMEMTVTLIGLSLLFATSMYVEINRHDDDEDM